MKVIPPKSVDIIVTSPPYNIGIEYGQYNDNQPFDAYLEMMNEFGRCCNRVLSDSGSLFFNIGDKSNDEFRSFLTAKSVRGDSLVLQNTFHWVKSISIPEHGINIGHFKPVNSRRYVNNCHEYIFHFTKSGNAAIDKLGLGVPYADKSNIRRWKHSKGRDLRDRGNQWFIPYKTVMGKKEHPAAFPVMLPKMCIKVAGYNKGTVVMDPFCGSGSTLIAASELGLKSIGIDIDRGYIQMIKDKLRFRSTF